MAGRGAWRQSRHRRLPRFCSDAVSHIALQCADASFCYRPRRGGVGDAGGIEPACNDAPDGALPPWGTQRRTRHRRMTTVSSTSGGFHRRRRRRRCLRGRQAAGQGTTFGAGCAARRAASAPSPPHLHSTRARSAPSCCGHELAPTWESERSSSVARARQGARRRGRAGRLQMERFSGAALPADAPGTGRSRAGGRAHRAMAKKGGRIKGGPSQYPERLLRSPFSGSPGF
jgi:hypothetical protein